MSKAIRTATISGHLPVDAALRPPTRVIIEAVCPFGPGRDPVYVDTHVVKDGTLITGRGVVEPNDDGTAEQTVICLPQPGFEPVDAVWRLRLCWGDQKVMDYQFTLTEDTSWSEIVQPDRPSVTYRQHLRVMHPEEYGDGPERWPDGGIVLHDDTLEPDDFGA